MTKSQKKKWIKLIALAAAAVVLVSVVLLIRFLSTDSTADPDPDAETGNFKAVNLVSSDIGRIVFKNENLEAAFLLKGEEWVYEADDQFPTNSDTLDQMLDIASSIDATQKISVSAEDLSQYGFDAPMNEISLFTKSGKETKLTVGKHNITTNQYYLRVNDETELYTIDATLPEAFACNLMDLGQIETIPSLTFGTIQNITIHNGDREYNILGNREYGLDMSGNTGWYIKEPFQLLHGLVEDMLDEYIDDITAFSFAKLQAYRVTEADYADYGLGEDCSRTIRFVYPGTSEGEDSTEENNALRNERALTIYVGNAGEADNYYYSRYEITEGNKIIEKSRIYLVTASQIAKTMNLNPLQYMYKNIVYVRLDDLKALSLTVGDETYDFEIRETGRKEQETEAGEETQSGALQYGVRILEYYCNGRKLDEEKFQSFYHTLISKSGNEILYKESQIRDGETIMKMHFEKLDSSSSFSVIDAELKSYNTGNYQATVNGATEMLVSKKDVNEIIDELHELTEE